MEKAGHVKVNDRFAEILGIEFLEVSQELATGRLNVRPDFCNGSDTVHGGALLTLANAVFAAASRAGGSRAAEASASISFKEAAECKILLAQARRIFSDGKLARYAVSVTNEKGEVLVTLEATASYPVEEEANRQSQQEGVTEVRIPRRRSVLPVQQYD